jgi:hypothetical protein
MNFQLIGVVAVFAALPVAFAQPAGVPPVSGEPTYIYKSAIGPADQTFEYATSAIRIEGGLVKNAPYSGQAVTETTQRLVDGNRILRKTTASLYRDSEGRTRREESMGMVTNGESVQSIFINDPVAGTSLVLDPRNKVARKMPQMKMPPMPPLDAAGGSGAVVVSEARRIAGVKAGGEGNVLFGPGMATASMVNMATVSMADNDAQRESLGTQTIEGVQAEGTRTTLTIPAGAIGNDLPIQIVSERWYSPDLHTVVMSKHSDPRMGDTTYKLTNINRSEPAQSLFEAPADYTVAEGGKPMMIMKSK